VLSTHNQQSRYQSVFNLYIIMFIIYLVDLLWIIQCHNKTLEFILPTTTKRRRNVIHSSNRDYDDEPKQQHEL
jgi:hypothetical protein